MFSLICAWINRWVNTRETGDSRRHRAHYDVIVMGLSVSLHIQLFHCIKVHSVPANERRRYTVTPSLIGWTHTQDNVNAIPHWLDACTEWSLLPLQWITLYKYVCQLFLKSYSRQQLYVCICIRRKIVTSRPILGRKSHHQYFESVPSQSILPISFSSFNSHWDCPMIEVGQSWIICSKTSH